MKNQYTEPKLIYMSVEQKEKLLEIKENVTETGGETSMNQLIRDAIDILLDMYEDVIVKKYTPIQLKDLINLNEE